MRLQHALILLVALPFIGACETQSSNAGRHFRSSVTKAKEMMIASAQQEGVQPTGLGGPTAAGVARNFHWNQNTVNAMSRRASGSGLLSLKGH
jgi:hypothetical protein